MQRIISAAIVVSTSIISQAATISPIGSKESGVQLNIKGELTNGDAELLESHFKQNLSLGLVVKGISLDSPGGLVHVGAAMAKSVRAKQIKTIVHSGNQCASACFMIFAAGKAKAAEIGSRIGVHSAVIPNRGELDSAKSATIDIARFLSELGVPPQIIGKMVTAKPSEMAWLTEEDLKAMNTVTTPMARPDSYIEKVIPEIPNEKIPQVINEKSRIEAREKLLEAIRWINLKNYSKAYEKIEQAIEKNPYDSTIITTKAEILMLQSRSKEAKDLLYLARDTNPQYSEPYKLLMQIFAADGDKDEAKINMKKYIETTNNLNAAKKYIQNMQNNGSTGKILYEIFLKL